MSIRVHAVSREKARCPFCHEALVGSGIPCPDCGATLHKECWADVRECPTLGCSFGATPASSSSSARARAARPAAPPRPPVARALAPPSSTAQGQALAGQARQGLSPPRRELERSNESKRQAHISASLAAYLIFCVTAIVASFTVPLPLAMILGCFTGLVAYLIVHKQVLEQKEPVQPPSTQDGELEAKLREPGSGPEPDGEL